MADPGSGEPVPQDWGPDGREQAWSSWEGAKSPIHINDGVQDRAPAEFEFGAF